MMKNHLVSVSQAADSPTAGKGSLLTASPTVTRSWYGRMILLN